MKKLTAISQFYTILDYNNLVLVDIYAVKEICDNFLIKENEEWYKTLPEKLAKTKPFRFASMPLEKAIEEIKAQMEARSDHSDEKR